MDRDEFFCELFKIVLNNQATIMKSMIDIEQMISIICKHDLEDLDIGKTKMKNSTGDLKYFS